MPDQISQNQYDYLTNLSKGTDGNAAWAKAQLGNSTLAPSASTPSNTGTSPNATGAATGANTQQSSVVSQINTGTPQTGTTGTTSTGTTGTTASGGVASQLNAVSRVNDPSWINDPNWQGKLQQIQSNPGLASAELERVKGQYNQEKANGATADRLNQISTWANQVRQAGGISANDPFFGNGAAPTADGSLGLNVNGQQQENVPVYQGTSYDSANKIATELGVSYGVDPLTQMPVIGGKTFNAVTFDKNGNAQVPLKLVAESLGFKADWNPKTNTVTVTGGPKQDQPQQGQSMGFQLPTFNAGNPNSLGNWSDYWNSQNVQQPQYMPIQSQFNPDWSTYYNQAHAQIDPLYQNQMNTLMGKQASDISGMDQKMNARGMFNSGIAQAAEDDLRAKTTNSVATLLTKQMSDIEKTAQTLFNQAYKQYSDGNTFALKYNQDQVNNYMAQQKQIFSQWLSTQKLDLSQQQYALNAWDKMATLQLNQYKFNNLSADQQANLNFNQYKFNNLSADQQANLNFNQYKFNNLSADQQAQLAWNQYKFNNLSADQQGTLNQGQQKIDLQSAAQQAANYFKQLGINVDMAKLQEAIRHDQAGEQNTADANKLKMMDIMGYDQNGRPTLNTQKLTETIAHDKDLITIATQNAKSTEEKNTLDAYGKNLTAINEGINAIMARHTDGNIPQGSADYQNLESLTNQRNDIIGQLNNYSFSGTYSTQITNSANKYGIDPRLVAAVAKQESDSGNASQNVMQVNGMDNASPADSIDTGTKMLASYMQQTGGSIPWSLAMYNMGPGILDWAKSQGISDPKQAMAAFSEFQQQQNGYSGYGDPSYIDHVMRYLG